MTLPSPSIQELESFIKEYCPYIQLQSPKPETIGKINTWPKTYASSDIFLDSKFEKLVWFPETEGGYKFELEVPRYSQDEISVTIEDDGFKTLVVFGEKRIGNNVSHCFTERYALPNDNLDLENASAKVENGLLSIFFQKLPASKTIKVL